MTTETETPTGWRLRPSHYLIIWRDTEENAGKAEDVYRITGTTDDEDEARELADDTYLDAAAWDNWAGEWLDPVPDWADACPVLAEGYSRLDLRPKTPAPAGAGTTNPRSHT